MRVTFRPLPAWPHPPRKRQPGVRFRVGWEGALDKLEEEIAAVRGSDVVIGVVVTEDQVGFSGNLKAGGRTRFGHRGAEVSFDMPNLARRVFFTDAFDDVAQNLRAIALGLGSLRAVERYGITSTSEQYAGFAMLGPGTDLVKRGQELVSAHGGLTKALKAAHPDHGGDPLDLQAVMAYKASVGA